MMRLDFAHTGTLTFPLAGGDRGVEQTIDAIRMLIDDGVKSAAVNRRALDYIRGAGNYDDLAKVRAVYEGVLRDFQYVMDPVGKETLRPADVILEVGAGDCDDLNGVLLPSLLSTIGYPVRLVTVASHPSFPEDFSHIYCDVYVGGQWIPLDVARPGTSFGTEPERQFRKQIWEVNGPEADVSAGVFSGGLGQVPPESQLISEVPAIISAIRGRQNVLYTGAPAAYPAASAGAATSGTTWLLLGAAALGFYLVTR
jgi:hypothetical protein